MKRKGAVSLSEPHTLHELLDELDVIECFMEPGKAPIQGEVLKKQEQMYRDLVQRSANDYAKQSEESQCFQAIIWSSQFEDVVLDVTPLLAAGQPADS